MAYPFPVGSTEIVAEFLTGEGDLDRTTVLLEIFAILDWITEKHGFEVVGTAGQVFVGSDLVEAVWDYAHQVKGSVPTPYGETLVSCDLPKIVRSLLSAAIDIVNSGE
jgi:hypothetical protein